MQLYKFSKKIVFVILVLSLFGGCRTSHRNMDKVARGLMDLDVIESNDLAAMQNDSSSEFKNKRDVLAGVELEKSGVLPRITPGMLLNVSVEVAGKDEIYREKCNVSRDGDIYLPLLESVDVAGMTVVEAEKKLAELCSQYFVEPQVDVSFSRSEQDNFVSPWGYVTVMGNVVDPQRIALPQGRKLKLSEAVALAGGLAPSAKSRGVVLIRRNKDGKIEKKKVNLRSIVAGGKIDRDVELLPNDYIFVPETIF